MDLEEEEECGSPDNQNRNVTPDAIKRVNTVNHGLSNVHSIHYLGNIIIIANPDTIKIWDIKYGTESLSTYPLTLSKCIMKMTPTETESLIMPCGWQSILLCNISTGQLQEYGITVRDSGDQFVASCTDIVTNRIVNTFVTSWDNGCITHWDLRFPFKLRSTNLTDEAIVSMDLNGHRLWTASRDNCLRCMDLRMEKYLVVERKFEHNLLALSFSPTQRLLAIGMDSGHIAVCNPEDMSGCIAHFGTGELTYLKHSRSGEWFVAAHERKIIISDSFYPVRSTIFRKLVPDVLDVCAISPGDKYITTINRTPYSQTYELRY